VTTVCTVPEKHEEWWASWSPDGNSIVLSGDQFYSVSAQGGVPKRIGNARVGFRHPSFLPIERLRLVLVSSGPPDLSQIAVVNVDTGETHKVADGSQPVYSRTGHILFRQLRDRPGVWALRFSLENLRKTGDAFPVADRAAFVTVSNDGTLVYVNEDLRAPRQLGWRDRTGAPLGTLGAPQAGIAGMSLSPDDRNVAVTNTESGSRGIWIQDARRGIATRLTLSQAPEFLPRWSPTGTEILHAAYRSGNWDVLIKAADGSSEPRIVAETSRDEYPTDWSADGNFLLIGVMNRLFDVWYAKRSGKSFELLPLLETEFNERLAAFSPDGRYFAHCSDKSGREEVYVRRFPDGSGKTRVSQNGGCKLQWTRDGKELFYMEGVGIAYVFLGKELGARSEDPSCYEHGRVQYDRLALTEQFKRGLDRVQVGMKEYRLALMCAEKEPLDCHRTVLVARHLSAVRIPIQHILADGRLESHADVLNRLMSQLALPESDMFRSHEDIVTDAYKIQESRIAYTVPESEPGVPTRSAAG